MIKTEEEEKEKAENNSEVKTTTEYLKAIKQCQRHNTCSLNL